MSYLLGVLDRSRGSANCARLTSFYGRWETVLTRLAWDSVSVLVRWQSWQRPWPLVSSCVPPCATGTMWSASVAGAPHGHCGSRWRMRRRVEAGKPLECEPVHGLRV